EILDFLLQLRRFGDLTGSVLLLLLARCDLLRHFVAAGLAALGFREIVAPLAVEPLEITQEIGDAALAHLLLDQLEVVAHKTEVEHWGDQLLRAKGYQLSVISYQFSSCRFSV